MGFGSSDSKEDLSFLKYVLPLLPGIFAALILFDYYGTFSISFISDLDIETKMIYLAYIVIGISVFMFLYFFKVSDNKKSMW